MQKVSQPSNLISWPHPRQPIMRLGPQLRTRDKVLKQETGSRAKQMPTARISAASHGLSGLSFPAFFCSSFPPPLPAFAYRFDSGKATVS